MGNNVTCENFDIEFGEVQIVGGEGGSDGYDVGYEDGYAKGNADGYAKGNAEGQEKGKAEGKEEGKQIGFADAISKQTELSVSYNGIYTPQNGSVGFNKVTVSVQEKKPNLQDKTFTANGTYSADENYDGLGSVVVAVPKEEIKLQEKTATENGEVVADAGFDGLSKVTVSVEQSGGGSDNQMMQLVNGTITKVSAKELEGATKIWSYGFYSRSALESVELPEGITFIESSAFAECRKLASINIPESLTGIGIKSFKNCSALKSFIIPESVTIIGSNAFEGSGITSITLPKNISSISGVFNQCQKLISVTLNEGLKSIGSQSFYYCTSLITITIPASVTSIDNQAFSFCTELDTIKLKSSTPPTIALGVFANSKKLSKIIVPVGSADAYKSATNWSAFADKIVEEGAV